MNNARGIAPRLVVLFLSELIFEFGFGRGSEICIIIGDDIQTKLPTAF